MTGERFDNFRTAMVGAIDGAVEYGDITPGGAASLLIITMAAARAELFGEDFEEAWKDELLRYKAAQEAAEVSE